MSRAIRHRATILRRERYTVICGYFLCQWTALVCTLWLATLGSFARADVSPEVVRRGKQATVLVEAEGGRRTGTAFCVDRAGFFVTNEHVSGATGAKLSLVLNPGEIDQKVLRGQVVRADRETDLALLKSETAPPLTTLPLGEIDGLVETQAVTAFGYPFGKELAIVAGAYPSVTVSTGRITSLRKVEGELHQIQLDASINPGNSGGPVLNERGQVIGVVVSSIRGSGINFAIPVSLLQRLLTQVELVFAPPVVSRADLHDAHEFTIEVAQFAQPAGGITVELILKTEGGQERVFPAKSVDGKRFTVSAVPVPAASGPHALRLKVNYRDGEVQCTIKDQTVSVGGKAYKLSQIKRIEHGSRNIVTLTDGRIVDDGLSGGATIAADLGGKPVSLDLQQATDIAVEDLELAVRAVDYRIVARQRGAVVGTEAGRILIVGSPEAAAQSRPELELLVCSTDKGEIKRYDGRTGAYLNDFAIGNGLQNAHNVVIGRDGLLYVSYGNGPIIRFSGKSGQFIDRFDNGVPMENSTGMAFGPDGNLYVADAWKNTIRRFDGKTGAYLGDFVKASESGLDVCGNIVFGPDGNLYAGSLHSHLVKKYNGRTGALLGDFAGGNGLQTPAGLVFGKDGCLYVASRATKEVKRFDGRTGAFIDNFVPAGTGGLVQPEILAFGPDGNLYVSDSLVQCVKRFNGRTGAFIGDIVPKASGGLGGAAGMVFRSLGGRP